MARLRTPRSLLLTIPAVLAFQSGTASPAFCLLRASRSCCQAGIAPVPTAQPRINKQFIHTCTHLLAKRKARNGSSSHKERSWLRWLDARLEETPVGELKSEVLKQMHPIMNIYAKQRSPEGAAMADKLMRRIVEEVNAGNEHAKLTTKICNTVLSARAKSASRDSSEEATKLLIWMSRMSREGKHEVKPNTISFSTAIDSCAKSGGKDSAKKAEAILELMQKGGSDARPNTISFNSVINAWARSNMMDKAVHAEDLLARMEELHKAGNADVRPDVWTYQSVISAWSSSKVWGAPQRCEELLQLMDEKYKGGDESVKPNALCFTAAINAWAKSRESKKARSAYRILQYMDKLYREGNSHVKPNVVAYTAALNACADSPDDETEMRECFDIALLVMEELRMSDYGMPNYLTYATFLRVCAKCLPEGEELDATVRRIFDQCCQDGQVGDVVLKNLQRHFPSLFRELLADQLNDHDDELRSVHLPQEWRRNVSGERKAPQRRKSEKGYKKSTGYITTDTPRDSISKLKMVQHRKGSRGFYSKEKSGHETEQKQRRNGMDEKVGSWRDSAKSLDKSSLL